MLPVVMQTAVGKYYQDTAHHFTRAAPVTACGAAVAVVPLGVVWATGPCRFKLVTEAENWLADINGLEVCMSRFDDTLPGKCEQVRKKERSRQTKEQNTIIGSNSRSMLDAGIPMFNFQSHHAPSMPMHHF